MPDYAVRDIIEFACRAGKIILENGGEIYRVEQTMSYICMAYGIAECESYATPTVIILSVSNAGGETYSRMLRITSRVINLDKVAAVNSLSRSLTQHTMPITEAAAILDNINRVPSYPFFVIALASSVGAGAFTIVFGGGLNDFLCGTALGALLRIVVHKLKNMSAGDFVVNLIGGSFAAIGGTAAAYIGIVPDWWIVTLSTLMLLVPGLLFTNALRDIAAGDLVSGISRGMEAFSIVAALAFGAAAIHTILALTRIGGLIL